MVEEAFGSLFATKIFEKVDCLSGKTTVSSLVFIFRMRPCSLEVTSGRKAKKLG